MDTAILIENKDSSSLPNRSIGAILIDVGKLTPDKAERILRLQRERGMRFGDAAIQLGLLTQADIDQALSRQFDYPYLLKGESRVSEKVVAAYNPFSPQVETLRALRSQLMLRWFDADLGHKALAVTSPAGGEGRSFLAANLAVVFSQLGERTLLIDGDMRNPRQHELFGLENRNGLSAVIAGRVGTAESIQRIPALIDLSVMTAGPTPPNPQELLGRPPFSQLLQELAPSYDVILIDTPPGNECADAQMVAVRTGAALMVVRKNVSHISSVRTLTDSFASASVMVVGSVLNEF
ncbi:chain length determinant protein tyrosine kinase EpsG [Herbaspirillum robiniae]|uniref:Chain length determinant protein tyrosine kinase EpsG n=1 Tax=Herbaspirillum robiniae TaxID=2014887 RepID=A0A246WVB3_9BURK|nr:chain length determinant protein tyrosine kinase EpsG [Herbaspirillum robiniae]NUU00246.1 chain length determinant protein tyrosine kinase EpsG [Herbaspirillum robiniae]OWY30974.1 chain length determinant protein tyrosine kinase EpsG [Herbaspirillum robiniae]